MALVASLLATLLACCSASKVVLRNNGYEGVVVALEDDLPPALCEDLIAGLEVSDAPGFWPLSRGLGVCGRAGRNLGFCLLHLHCYENNCYGNESK